MSKSGAELLAKAKSGATLTFRDLVNLAKAAGYSRLTSTSNRKKKASSHERYRCGVCVDAKDMNFQRKGKDAKPYQVRQLVDEIEFHGLLELAEKQQ